MPDTQSRAVYTVDWSGQGYDQLMQQMREFMTIKKQLDTMMRQSPLTGGGRPMTDAQAVRAAQQQQTIIFRQQVQAQRDARQAQQDAERSAERQAQAQRRAAREQETAQRKQTQEQQRAQREQEQAQRKQAQSQRLQENEAKKAATAAERQRQSVPHVFAGATMPGAGASDEEWLKYNKHISEIHERALKNGEKLTQADSSILRNTQQIAGMVGQRKQLEERKGGLSRAINAIGWMPGIPPEVYYGQMALGEMGLGLGTAGVAGGLGIGALAALGLGVNSTLASQTAMAQMLAGISSTGGGVTPGPADKVFAQTIANKALDFNVDRGQAMKLLPTIGAYNLTNQGTIASTLYGGLGLAQMGQLTNEQGVQLQSLVTARMFGGDANKAIAAFAQLDNAIRSTGANAHATYQDILSLGDSLTPGTNLTQFAQVNAGLASSGETAGQVYGSALSAIGMQRESSAVLFQAFGGVPQGKDAEAYYRQLQNNPEQFALVEKTVLQNILKASGGNVSIAQGIAAPLGITTQAEWDAALNISPVSYQQPNFNMAQWLAQGNANNIAAGGAVRGAVPIGNQVGPQVGQRIMSWFGNEWSATGAANSALGAGFRSTGLGEYLGKWLDSFAPARADIGNALHGGGQTPQVTVVTNITLDPSTGQIKGQTTQTTTVTPGPGAPNNVNVVPSATPTPTSTSGR